jgi:hypothetical protein
MSFKLDWSQTEFRRVWCEKPLYVLFNIDSPKSKEETLLFIFAGVVGKGFDHRRLKGS